MKKEKIVDSTFSEQTVIQKDQVSDFEQTVIEKEKVAESTSFEQTMIEKEKIPESSISE